MPNLNREARVGIGPKSFTRRQFIQATTALDASLILTNPLANRFLGWLARGFSQGQIERPSQTQSVIGPVYPHEVSSYLRVANPTATDEELWAATRLSFWSYASYSDGTTAHGFQREATLFDIFQEFYQRNGYLGSGPTSLIFYDRPFGSPINYDLGEAYPDPSSYAQKLQADLVATHPDSVGNLIIMSPPEGILARNLPQTGEMVHPLQMELPEVIGYVDALLRQAEGDAHYRNPAERNPPIRLVCLTWSGTQGNAWLNTTDFDIDVSDDTTRRDGLIRVLNHLLPTLSGPFMLLPRTVPTKEGTSQDIHDFLNRRQDNFPESLAMNGWSLLPSPEIVVATLARSHSSTPIPTLNGFVRGKPQVFLPLAEEIALFPSAVRTVPDASRITTVRFPAYQPAPIKLSGRPAYVRVAVDVPGAYDPVDPHGPKGYADIAEAIFPEGGSTRLEWIVERDESDNPTGVIDLVYPGSVSGGGGNEGCLPATAKVAGYGLMAIAIIDGVARILA